MYFPQSVIRYLMHRPHPDKLDVFPTGIFVMKTGVPVRTFKLDVFPIT